MKKSKKRILSSLIILSLIIPTWYISNYSLKLNEQTVYSSKIENDIKIALISDLHGTKFGKDNIKIINMISERKPDLIFVLGDMYTRNKTDRIDDTVEFIKKLSEIASTYVVTGDHDTDDEYKEKLKSNKNIHLMDYKSEDIAIKNNNITIYGIDNVYFTTTFDLHNAFNEPNRKRFNILLSHIPEIEKFKDFGVDIIFSGDTHGGLIRIPLLGPIYYNGYIFPKLTYPNEMTDKGLYYFDNKKIFVTSGLGDYPIPLRFLNRPEICMITLKKETTK